MCLDIFVCFEEYDRAVSLKVRYACYSLCERVFLIIFTHFIFFCYIVCAFFSMISRPFLATCDYGCCVCVVSRSCVRLSTT